jgi:hypothetical protein
MDTLQRALNRDTSGYEPTETPPPLSSQLEHSLFPQRSTIQICSLPNLPGSFPSTNNILDYYIGGKAPQFRAPLPPPTSAQGAGTGNSTTIVTSSSSSTTNNPPASQSVSLTTPPLNTGSTFQTTVTMAKAFDLQTVSTANPVRVQLYSTAFAQSADIFRASNIPPGLGTEQGLLGDIYLDTTPIVWQVGPAIVGRNGDSPQTSTIYVTITNLGASGAASTVTFVYVPMQS